MVIPSTGIVVLVKFPFSDLSNSKLRPALVIADAGRGDWILCQITSNPYGDISSVEILQSDFQKGSLRITSYVRPSKLFTASSDLMVSEVGTLKNIAFEKIVTAIVSIIKSGLHK